MTVADVNRLLTFMQQVFDAQVVRQITQPDGAITYLEVRIGDSMLLFGKSTPDWDPMPSSLYLYVQDTDALYARGIAAGATSLMEPADMYYGDRNAGLRDMEGNFWWIATHQEELSQEELQQRDEATRKQTQL
jgi:uncharacterized glyoxalase superfamily protein PhnB